MFFAMSFPLWRCRADGCGQYVEWADAHYELDGDRLVAVFHKGCA